MEFVDQLNRAIKLSKTPDRIISLVPSQTELLVDLGLRERIVGITKFCVHPEDLKNEKAIVGGTKQVNFDKIKLLQPNIIICNKEENTKEMVSELEKIAPVWISDIESVSDSLDFIARIGEVFKVAAIASEIISKINCELKKHQEFAIDLDTKKVLYLIWKGPYMAAGRGTFIDSLLHINNFENVFSQNQVRYPQVEPADFRKADLILLSTEPYPFKKKDVQAFKNEFEKEVKLVDGEYFSWYGSRLIQAFKYFKTLH
ncbi:ABC transporter substrate-binding protein [Aequorivita marisscotiae]|uniref:Helical backbone metal receptor n=1 Tax=Aequorivita marisscotiae TaxID=3040348 RepID=A0ABY8KSZ5_9FLAO|nr:helical backbone metal receptor [Aequorivita sp. Ant34-E75]WGF91190.1 helical backbone metal receptor [Aequorivita sp. Ant34-E75]